MILVKFDHSVKYNGIRHSAHEVFQADDKDLEALKKSGAIIMQKDEQEEVNDAPAGGDAPVQETADETSAHIKEDLLGYTVAELTKFAEENGIDLQGKTRKADIYNVIVAHFQ